MSVNVEPQELRYRASGLSFGALAWGPADGPLALCLHGYPDTAWTWRHLGPHLAQDGWRVVAPFMRGYAPTDLAPDGTYQVGALARDAIESHGALGGDDRAVLIGHDWGAIASYVAGAHSPGLFRRVVALAVPPLPIVFGPLMSPKRLAADLPLVSRQLRYSWYTIFQQLPWISERALPWVIPRLWADWSPGFDGSADVARVFEALNSPQRATAALRYYRALAQPWYRSRTYASEQSNLLRVPACPLLYLHGRDDGCLQSAYAERAAAAPAPGTEVAIVEGAGHFLQLEQPDIVNTLITAFITEQ